MVSLLTLLFPNCSDVLLQDIELENTTVILCVESTKMSVACPSCAMGSSKVHSRYIRQPADLPWMQYRVRLHLEVRRFFCQNESCPRKTFAEPFPQLVQAYARRTLRQTHWLEELAFALGGKPGACLAEALGCSASRETLLRLLRGKLLPPSPTPRVLGIDEWAWRKGRTYGTILVDLERHCPVDLLPDRSVASVEAWLKAHPGIQIVSRDRSELFAEVQMEGESCRFKKRYLPLFALYRWRNDSSHDHFGRDTCRHSEFGRDSCHHLGGIEHL